LDVIWNFETTSMKKEKCHLIIGLSNYFSNQLIVYFSNQPDYLLNQLSVVGRRPFYKNQKQD